MDLDIQMLDEIVAPGQAGDMALAFLGGFAAGLLIAAGAAVIT